MREDEKEVLSEKEEVFVRALAQGLEPVAAYRQAYPRSRAQAKTIEKRVERYMGSAVFRRRYEELMAEVVPVDDSVADAQEVLAHLTAVMRGEKRDSLVIPCKSRVSDYDEQGRKVVQEVVEPVVMEVPVKVADANRAAELLGKRYGLFTDRVQVGCEESIRIVDDIVGDVLDVKVE